MLDVYMNVAASFSSNLPNYVQAPFHLSSLLLPPTQFLRPRKTLKIQRLLLIKRMPMPQRTSNNPVLSRNLLLHHSPLQLRYFPTPIQPLHQHILLGPSKVHKTISRVICLRTRRRYNAVDI